MLAPERVSPRPVDGGKIAEVPDIAPCSTGRRQRPMSPGPLPCRQDRFRLPYDHLARPQRAGEGRSAHPGVGEAARGRAGPPARPPRSAAAQGQARAIALASSIPIAGAGSPSLLGFSTDVAAAVAERALVHGFALVLAPPVKPGAGLSSVDIDSANVAEPHVDDAAVTIPLRRSARSHSGCPAASRCRRVPRPQRLPDHRPALHRAPPHRSHRPGAGQATRH